MSATLWVVTAEFLVALLSLIYFVIGYVASSRGRALRTPEGRHLLSFRGSLVVFMTMAIVHNLVGQYPGCGFVAIVVVGWFALSAVGGARLMTRAQLARRRARRAAVSEVRDTP